MRYSLPHDSRGTVISTTYVRIIYLKQNLTKNHTIVYTHARTERHVSARPKTFGVAEHYNLTSPHKLAISPNTYVTQSK